MAPFETIITDGEEDLERTEVKEKVVEKIPGLNNIEKMNILRLLGKIDSAMTALEGAIDNFPESKELTNPNLQLDVYPKILSVIGRYKEENSLESKNRGIERDLSDYEEYKERLDEFGNKVAKFLDELRARAQVKDRLMTKSQLKEKFHDFLDESFTRLKDSADIIVPTDN